MPNHEKQEVPAVFSVSRSAQSRRGNAAIEVGLLLPWIVFSFVGILDFGFCAYGMIATQDAARIGANWGAVNSTNAQSGSFTSTACSYALSELEYAPNVGTSVTTCGGTSPVSVVTQYSASGADGLPTVTVTVTYTVTLMAIPGMMPATLAINRTVQLPVR